MSSQITVITNSMEETEELAQTWALKFAWKDRIALLGGLGAGKTCFARGLYRGLGGQSDELVTSPTFTLMQTYAVKGGFLHHWDWYRLSHLAELYMLDWEEMWDEDNSLHLVEWGDRFESSSHDFTHVISLKNISSTQREISLSGANFKP